MSDTRTVTVHYFAALREQRGIGEESIETTAATPRELYEELRARHALTLQPADLQVAINEEVREWDTALQEGDTVVFLPPVAGG
jgi:molybdopterin converting factor subunit 1